MMGICWIRWPSPHAAVRILVERLDAKNNFNLHNVESSPSKELLLQLGAPHIHTNKHVEEIALLKHAFPDVPNCRLYGSKT